MAIQRTATTASLGVGRDGLTASIDQYLSDAPLPDPTRAEIALYLQRVDEAEEALDRCGASPLAELLRAEAEIQRKHYGAARERFEALSGASGILARIENGLATCAKSVGDHARAAKHAERAIVAARREGDAIEEGKGYRIRGISLSEIDGENEQVADNLRKAVEILCDAEDGRFRAQAEMSLAAWAASRGEAGEALALLDSAESTFLRFGLELLAQSAQHARLWAYLAVGDFDAVLARTGPCIAISRSQASAEGEAWGLHVGALAAVLSGRIATALDYAGALLGVLRVSGSIPDLVEAHLVDARARARAGDRGALEDLDEYLDAAEETKLPLLIATGRVLRADALLGLDAAAAFAARDAAEPGRTMGSPWLRAEFRNLDVRWAREPIRMERGSFVFDPSAGLPSRKDAHLILDYVLAAEARRAANGAETAAARLLGESRNSFWNWSERAAVRMRAKKTRAKSRRAVWSR